MGMEWWYIWMGFIAGATSVEELRSLNEQELPEGLRLPPMNFKTMRQFLAALLAARKKNGGRTPKLLREEMIREQALSTPFAGKSRLLRHRIAGDRRLLHLPARWDDIAVVCYEHHDYLLGQTWVGSCVAVLPNGMPMAVNCTFAGDDVFFHLQMAQHLLTADSVYQLEQQDWLSQSYLDVTFNEPFDAGEGRGSSTRSLHGVVGDSNEVFILLCTYPDRLRSLTQELYHPTTIRDPLQFDILQAKDGYFQELKQLLNECSFPAEEVIGWGTACGRFHDTGELRGVDEERRALLCNTMWKALLRGLFRN